MSRTRRSGRAVIGGLLFATGATLLFVPVVFSLMHGNEQRSSESDLVAGIPHVA